MTDLTKKIVYALLSLYLMFCVGLLYWAVAYSGSGDGDTLEHVHTSWMVYRGKIPYVDFFQHHNPLIWYVGAPFVGMYEFSLRAVDAVNYVTATATVLTMFYIYRMHKNFLTNSLCGMISAAFFAFAHNCLYGKDFKPDNFMAMSMIIGIHYLLKYLNDQKLFSLVTCFLWLFSAFMFTQKAALILVCIGGWILYLISQKKMSLTDCVMGAALPILIYVTFLTFLWSRDALTLYFKANFELNSHIPDVFFTRRFIHPSTEMLVPIALSLYALAKCAYNGNVYVKTVSYIFMAEFIIRQYYFTPFVYYFAFLHGIASVLAGVAIKNITDKKPWMIWLFVIYFMTLGGIYAHIYRGRITVGDSYKYGAAGFVLENTTPCDYIVNGYRIGYNLFSKDIDYIWNLKGQIDVIAATIGIYPLGDLEALIRKYKPKIISGGNYYDTYMEYRGFIGMYPIHWISKKLLEDMYEPLNRDDLYILKPEYQSHDCRYNPRTKTFEYYDKH